LSRDASRLSSVMVGSTMNSNSSRTVSTATPAGQHAQLEFLVKQA
jgi:hypothetical protein